MATLKQLENKSFSYNEENKKQLHNAALKALRKLAANLDLEKSSYDVRSNKAGIAVSGEITLHADKIYVQISESFMGPGLQVMYRTCNHRKDYTGHQNNYATVDKLEDPVFIKRIKDMMERVKEPA